MLRWLLRQLWDRLYKSYLNVKYSLVIKKTGLPSYYRRRRRGLIIIQIDALAYEYLLKALERRYMPFLKRLLKGGDYKLALWECGLPSTTPAIQAGLLFGTRFNICGFRWYEKDTGLKVEGKNPQTLQVVQSRIARKHQGLLKDGSCYFSMLDGEASLSLFTLGAINASHLFQNLRGTTAALLFLLHPWRVLRVIGLSLWEYIRSLVKMAFHSAIPLLRPEFNPIQPLTNILVNVLFRELQTYACLTDIYREVPVIYSNYYGYDEVAHQAGPASGEAFRVLKGIDKQLRQIFHLSSKVGNYDIFILSDHGMSPSVPFEKAYGYTLGEFISHHLHPEMAMEENRGPEKASESGIRMVLREMELWEKRISGVSMALFKFVKGKLAQHLTIESGRENPSSGEKVVVSCSGPLAHIYFTRYKRRLNLSEISSLYPGLVEKLVEHEGIGLVVARQGRQLYLLSRKGTLVVDERGQIPDPTLLADYGDPETLLRELTLLASYPHSGDLIVLGALVGNGAVITFEDQRATHGGAGGPQTHPFIIYPAYVPLRITPQTRAEDLYRFFKSYYRGLEASIPHREQVQAPAIPQFD